MLSLGRKISRTKLYKKLQYKKCQYKKCCLTWLKVNTIIKITEFRTKKEYKICWIWFKNQSNQIKKLYWLNGYSNIFTYDRLTRYINLMINKQLQQK